MKVIDRSVKIEAPTWSQIYRLLLKISEQICSVSFSPEVIVGVSRGGWIPARVLSDLLGNSNLASVKVECYSDIATRKAQAKLTQCISTSVMGRRVLVVDEIADSGSSLSVVLSHLKQEGAREIKSAVVYLKPNSAFKPDFYAKKTTCWVTFPWEIRETLSDILQSRKTNPKVADLRIEALAEAGLPKWLMERFRDELAEVKAC